MTIGNRKMRVTLTKILIRKRNMIRTDDTHCLFLNIIKFKCYWSSNKETSTEAIGEKGRCELCIWVAGTWQVRERKAYRNRFCVWIG